MAGTTTSRSTVRNIKNNFENHGFFAPIDVLSLPDLGDAVDRYNQLQQRVKDLFGSSQRFKLHLLVNWLADIVRHDAILDAVEQIIGPDILCWSTDFFLQAST